ncbi:zinc finger protein 227-like [Mercenaria mercenaria]|uniref:zinc finger protein 227-like n=1 Tax=Mercenaria mercenaria TaxID=6596 RepID=UPI00234F3C7D|nr:zinc finger protein 227-like [Mercenaria mercenaria]XP_045210032.2 zinc finger protein 227-like [Mercenaria mercenaria]
MFKEHFLNSIKKMEELPQQNPQESRDITFKEDSMQKLTPEQISTSSARGSNIITNEESNECHVCLLSKLDKETEGMELGDEKVNSSRESYHCGVCSQTFCTICRLHNHLTTYHLFNGSYHYDNFIQTAFPKYESLCQFTQTEGLDFNREGEFDIAERNRTDPDIKQKYGEVKKAIGEKKECNEPITTNKMFENVGSVETIWRDVKVEPAEFAENKETAKLDENDGYYSDRTDDYFENEEDMLTDLEIENHHNYPSWKDRKAVTSLNNSSGKGCAVKTTKTCNNKRKSKNDSLIHGQKNDEPVLLNEKNFTNIDANTSVQKKFGAKDSSVKNAKQKCGKKSKIAKLSNLTEQENSKDWYQEYKHVDNLESNKLIRTLKATNGNQSNDKLVGDNFSKNTDKNEGNKCDVCGAMFTVKQGLLRHEQLKHKDLMNFNCKQCDKKFMRNFNLQKHIIRVHGGKKSNEHKFIIEIEGTCEEDFGSNSLELSSDQVHSGTPNVKDDQEGVQSEEIIVTDGVKTPRRKRRTNEEMKSLKTPHTCDLCGHTMPRSKMDVHQRLHTGERPFICTICGKGLISQNKLSRHMLIHGEVKRHTCEICGAGFHMKYKLRMHMHIHTGKKPYLCSICGAEFNHSANLATHTRCVHLQVKPYVCNICGGKYSKRSQLDDHVLSHSTERQFTCRYCGKSFKYFKGMRRHEKSHNEEESFICNQCGLKFSRKENLDRHKISHGVASFQCKTCKKVLKDGRALQEHEFTHLVAKGCKCSVCGEMFYSSNKYFTHLFVMHNIQKQDAQLMIIDEKLQRDNKQADVRPNVPLSSNSGITSIVTADRPVASLDGILDNASKDTMSVLTRVATENLRLHSQDVQAEEKGNTIIPPLNPMILYEKNRITSLDNTVGANGGFSVQHKVLGNTVADTLSFPDHAYGQSVKQQVESHGDPHGNINMTLSDSSAQHQGLNENVLGFVTSNALTSINNLTSYMGQRQTSLTALTNLTTGLHQDEHSAIESLRRLQDNAVAPVSLIPATEGMVANQGQRNVGMPSTGTIEGNVQSDYRIQNLY